jgi:hypothetical protein
VVEVGLVEVEVSDSILRKTVEVMLNGWPSPIQRPENRIKMDGPVLKTTTLSSINADLEGLVVRMRVKKDVSTLKVLGLKYLAKEDSKFKSSLKLSLDDFQIMH